MVIGANNVMKKLPVRMCTACRENKSKKELVRVVRTPDGEILVDMTGRKSGRGAYICPTRECFMKAKKQKSFERAFSCSVDETIYERLLSEIENIAELSEGKNN